MINVVGLHFDPEYYPDPETFNPDNFMKEAKEQRHPYVQNIPDGIIKGILKFNACCFLVATPSTALARARATAWGWGLLWWRPRWPWRGSWASTPLSSGWLLILSWHVYHTHKFTPDLDLPLIFRCSETPEKLTLDPASFLGSSKEDLIVKLEPRDRDGRRASEE